jgi:hypothetical protein
MIEFLAVWCFVFVLPVAYLGWFFLNRPSNLNESGSLNGSYSGVPPQVPGVGLVILGCLGLIMEIVGIVVWEKPFLFYTGLGIILLLEAYWLRVDLVTIGRGECLSSAIAKITYRSWMVMVVLLSVLAFFS